MNCCSCGKEFKVLVHRENVDFFFERDKDDDPYIICTPCKEYWDKEECTDKS